MNENNTQELRIIYLPPAAVASAQYIGEEPEFQSQEMLDKFIKETNLAAIKPDLRVYGFNNPSPSKESSTYGYEYLVTIPEDMEVPAPLTKKTFAGGFYAACHIKMGDFFKWQSFHEAVKDNTEYEFDAREPLGMGGCMEEHLNAYYHYNVCEQKGEFDRLDLLIPVKKASGNL